MQKGHSHAKSAEDPEQDVVTNNGQDHGAYDPGAAKTDTKTMGRATTRARDRIAKWGVGELVINVANKSLDSHCLVCGATKDKKWTAFARA